MKLTETLWDRYGRLSINDIPTAAKTVASHCVLDWFGCALAGSREPLSLILRSEFGLHPGPATILGTDLATTAAHAALINGTAGHALDFDDTHTIMGGHPTVPVFPAALAQAQELGSSGAELLTAYVVGVEVESRIGAVVGAIPYTKGWHSTSTIGIYGATAAVCHLLGASREQFGHAIGLAGSQASGLKANFGTMTKPFHAGHAAERGLIAARLAGKGFTANPEVIEGKQGYAEAAATGAGDLRWEQLEKYKDRWLIQDTLFKYHAACYLTHAAIESVGLLRQQIGDREVKGATVTVNPGLLDVCGIPRPTTGLEAKFSLTATTSMAILGIDTTDINTFVDETLDKTELQQMIEMVTVATDRDLSHTQSKVQLDLGSETAQAHYDTGVAATDLAWQESKLSSKFQSLVEPVLGLVAAKQLESTVKSLASLKELTW